LPHEADLREAIGRVAKFLEGYRNRNVSVPTLKAVKAAA